MKKLAVASVATILLGSCSDEPEVVVVEPPEEDEVAYLEDNAASDDWDADGDGLLDRDEYSNLVGQAASQWDSDQDLMLSQIEFAAGWTEAGLTDATRAFEAFDDDADESLTEAEISGSSTWQNWDTDDSGVLEAEEFAHY